MKSVKERKKGRREATVYDAVAGRVGSNGFLPATPYASRNRDTLSSSTISLPPEEVLFRRRAAPVRYEGRDFYFAHENLPQNTQLPSSDLLKAIHQYVSDFYSRATTDHGQCDFRSLDETALIAMGVLLEEAMKDALGEAGDLVFTEPAYLDNEPMEDQRTKAYVKGTVPRNPEAVSRNSEAVPEEPSSETENTETDSERAHSRKRPRNA